jgi:hypothetical protein
LNAIQKNYEIVSLNLHGDSKYAWIGGNEYITIEDIKQNPPGALFIALESCNNGDLTDPNYFAGWVLFAGNSLLVKANTVQTMYIEDIFSDYSPYTFKEYKALASGASFGDNYKNQEDNEQSILFGDPTIRLRSPITTNNAQVKITPENIDFGKINYGEKQTKTIQVENKGIEPLHIIINGYYSILNGNEDKWSGTLNHFELNPNFSLNDFIVDAHSSKELQISLEPEIGIGGNGLYEQKYAFITNDPDKIFTTIHIQAELTGAPELKCKATAPSDRTIKGIVTKGGITSEDYCNGNYLIQFSCGDNDNISQTQYGCYCQNGACQEEGCFQINESNASNKAKKWVVDDPNVDGYETYQDYCVPDPYTGTPVQSSSYLRQAYCNGLHIIQETIKCPNQCFDGVCE